MASFEFVLRIFIFVFLLLMASALVTSVAATSGAVLSRVQYVFIVEKSDNSQYIWEYDKILAENVVGEVEVAARNLQTGSERRFRLGAFNQDGYYASFNGSYYANLVYVQSVVNEKVNVVMRYDGVTFFQGCGHHSVLTHRSGIKEISPNQGLQNISASLSYTNPTFKWVLVTPFHLETRVVPVIGCHLRNGLSVFLSDEFQFNLLSSNYSLLVGYEMAYKLENQDDGLIQFYKKMSKKQIPSGIARILAGGKILRHKETAQDRFLKLQDLSKISLKTFTTCGVLGLNGCSDQIPFFAQIDGGTTIIAFDTLQSSESTDHCLGHDANFVYLIPCKLTGVLVQTPPSKSWSIEGVTKTKTIRRDLCPPENILDAKYCLLLICEPGLEEMDGKCYEYCKHSFINDETKRICLHATFHLGSLKSVSNNLCLTITEKEIVPKTPVQLKSCESNHYQKLFYDTSKYVFRTNLKRELCVDFRYMRLADCQSGEATVIYFMDSGELRVESLDPNLCLQANGNIKTRNSFVKSCDGSNSQRWQMGTVKTNGTNQMYKRKYYKYKCPHLYVYEDGACVLPQKIEKRQIFDTDYCHNGWKYDSQHKECKSQILDREQECYSNIFRDGKGNCQRANGAGNCESVKHAVYGVKCNAYAKSKGYHNADSWNSIRGSPYLCAPPENERILRPICRKVRFPHRNGAFCYVDCATYGEKYVKDGSNCIQKRDSKVVKCGLGEKLNIGKGYCYEDCYPPFTAHLGNCVLDKRKSGYMLTVKEMIKTYPKLIDK